MHEAIKDLIQAEDEFSAEDWKFLANYGAVAEIKGNKKHEQEKMKENIKGCCGGNNHE